MTAQDLDISILARVSTAVAEDPNRATTSGHTEAARTRKSWTLPGVYGATRISTSFGEVPAHLIRVRDQLRTREGDFVRVLRIDEYKLDGDFLEKHPEACPIRFVTKKTRDAGSAVPVLLSPGQVVLARNAAGTESLRAAREFMDQPGVMPETTGPFSYFIFHLGKAALVRAEGMWIAMGA